MWQEDPLEQFDEWFEQARSSSEKQPDAMALASVTKSGEAEVRLVLYKLRKANSFYFFTNYMSPKALQIEANPNVSAVFFWGELNRQLRLSGRVARASEAESDAYWATRPRGSQIAAWASKQSQAASDEQMEQAFREAESKFKDIDPIPRPDFWGGYGIEVRRLEFWIGRPDRFHARRLYQLHSGAWKQSSLMP